MIKLYLIGPKLKYYDGTRLLKKSEVGEALLPASVDLVFQLLRSLVTLHNDITSIPHRIWIELLKQMNFLTLS